MRTNVVLVSQINNILLTPSAPANWDESILIKASLSFQRLKSKGMKSSKIFTAVMGMIFLKGIFDATSKCDISFQAYSRLQYFIIGWHIFRWRKRYQSDGTEGFN